MKEKAGVQIEGWYAVLRSEETEGKGFSFLEHGRSVLRKIVKGMYKKDGIEEKEGKEEATASWKFM